MVNKIIIALVIAVVAIFGSLWFIPSGTCDVAVTTTMSQAQFIIGSYYNVNGVTATSDGKSAILDLNGLGFAWPALTSSYQLTLTVGSHTKTLDETKILASLGVGAGSVSTTATLGYISPGVQQVTASLTVNGASQGSASTTVNVGC